MTPGNTAVLNIIIQLGINFLQLVFVAVAAVAYATEEAKVVLPLTYSYPYALSSPLIYNYQPVVQKLVPKEYEVEIKSYQAELVDTGCKNAFGNPVPCAKAKRQAEEAAEEAAAKDAVHHLDLHALWLDPHLR